MSFLSTGEYLIRLLEAYEVDYVFGIPGVHTAELYKGLERSRIRHITPRHEQGAGFMADGYARSSGKPGVCLVITGPGLSNISTAMLQARADSIPMLVLTAINNPEEIINGRLHEMPDQSAFAKTVALTSTTIKDPADLPAAIEEAYRVFQSKRPGPVHIEVPLDVMKIDCSSLPQEFNCKRHKVDAPDNSALQQAASLLERAERPIILAGGGARHAASALIKLCEKLAAPVITTLNARSAFPLDHPQILNASASLETLHNLINKSDCVLAVGTELGPTDYDMFAMTGLPTYTNLIRLDIDMAQISQNAPATIALCGDAASGINGLLEKVAGRNTPPADLGDIRASIDADKSPGQRAHIALLEAIRDQNPETVFVGDSTQLTYAGNLYFNPGDKGEWFNSATGYGTLGYGLSAAIGAKLANPEKPVLAIIGDGGIQFSLGELGTLRDIGLPVTVLIWNNDGYGEIKSYMENHDIKPEGVDLMAPDFAAIAAAYGLKAVTLHGPDKVPDTIATSFRAGESLVLDVRVK